jgi:integrase
MGSAHILVRVRGADGRWRAARPGEKGERRYIVRWRLGGRDSRLRHGGSERTRKLAEARRGYILEELAAGRVPDLNPSERIERSPTVEALVADHIAARVDVDEATIGNYGSSLRRLPPEIRAMRVGELTPVVVQRWINRVAGEGRLGASSIGASVALLRDALARAGIDPNPVARDRLTLPVYHSPEVRPPSAAYLVELVRSLPERWGPILCVIEGSGMRIGEAEALLARDVDRSRGRILVRRERTKKTTRAGRHGERWIPLRPATLALIPDDVGPDRPVLGFSGKSLQNILYKRTTLRGRPTLTPHMLRHRYASRLVMQGVPITVVRERLGHSSPAMTLNVYSHVLIDDDVDPVLDLADLLP